MTAKNVWGPELWRALHRITVAYPADPSDAHKLAVVQFFKALPYLVPCPECGLHFEDMLKRTPIEYHVDSKSDLARWLFERHNEVNARLGKPQMSEHDFVRMYTTAVSAPEHFSLTTTHLILAAIVVILIVMVLRR